MSNIEELSSVVHFRGENSSKFSLLCSRLCYEVSERIEKLAKGVLLQYARSARYSKIFVFTLVKLNVDFTRSGRVRIVRRFRYINL